MNGILPMAFFPEWKTAAGCGPERKGYKLATAIVCLLLPCTCLADSFTVGVVPQFDARTLHQTWIPIVKELERRTGHTFTLHVNQDIPAFEQQLQRGEFDFAYMNPYHLIHVEKTQGYIPLVRDTATALTGILVVRKDSPYRQVTDLRGKTIAFPSPNALAASLLIRAMLTREFSIPFQPQYAQNHNSVYLNVALSTAAAGGGVTQTLAQQPAEVRDQLRILYATTGVAAHPLAAHPRVPPAIRARVQRNLLAMNEQEEGRQQLARIPILHIGPAQPDDYASLRNMNLDAFRVE